MHDLDTNPAVPAGDPALARIVARMGIEDALTAYAMGSDERDEQLLLSAFHDDAIFDVAFGDAVLKGHDEIRVWAAAMFKIPDLNHLPGNRRFDFVDDSNATCVGLGAGVFGLENGSLVLVNARVEDRFERRDGTWRIAHRKVRHLASYRLHADDLHGMVA